MNGEVLALCSGDFSGEKLVVQRSQAVEPTQNSAEIDLQEE